MGAEEFLTLGSSFQTLLLDDIPQMQYVAYDGVPRMEEGAVNQVQHVLQCRCTTVLYMVQVHVLQYCIWFRCMCYRTVYGSGGLQYCIWFRCMYYSTVGESRQHVLQQ